MNILQCYVISYKHIVLIYGRNNIKCPINYVKCKEVKSETPYTVMFPSVNVGLQQCHVNFINISSGHNLSSLTMFQMMSQGRATPVPHLMGLLSKDLPNGTAQQYTSEGREAALVAESHNILLPNVTCSDSGLYTCRLAAPVGEQNQEGQVLLTLTGESQTFFSSSGTVKFYITS